MADNQVTHVAGTFLIQADGAFLNGAGIDTRREDQNTTIPKTYHDGLGNRVPYVSAQAWRRWLRNTLIEETDWKASQLRAIGLSDKGTTNKIAGELNPVEFPEDDIFGYMRATKGQGRESVTESDGDRTEEELKRDDQVKFFKRAKEAIKIVQAGKEGKGKKEKKLSDDDRIKRARQLLQDLGSKITGLQEEEDDAFEEWMPTKLDEILSRLTESPEEALKSFQQALAELVEVFNPGRLKSLMRSSPFATSLLVSVRRKGWEGLDKGYVHLQVGTPQPYNTEFYNTNLQGIFCLDYARLGQFWNLGDRIELDEEKVKRFLEEKRITVLRDEGSLGKVYEMVGASLERKKRATALFNALAVLRGGAKQAQFGTDTAPKALILAGLSCGNPVFNHLFKDTNDGPELKIEAFKEILGDYAARIVTPVLVGVRADYLANQTEVQKLNGWYTISMAGDKAGGVIGRTPSRLNGPTQEKGEGTLEVRVMTPIEAAGCIGDLLP
jgi:CRISPR/Cas system-associated protein Cas7 (RAMP superfamily)